MNYKKSLQFLYSQLPMYQRIGKAAYKADLETTIALDTYFKHPHKRFKSIHIAGTNGKGSVSHMLAAVLQTSGYKTGLYTSPHLIDFRERIKVNGKSIDKKQVVKFVRNHQAIIDELKPSFFEMTVAMAFDFFAKEEVDFAIIETGMGGRLDSTNIINPELSVITNISKDHTQFLGKTIPEIAREKAGIIKPSIAVVVGETQNESRKVFTDIARKNQSSIAFADQELKVSTVMLDPNGYRSYYIEKDGVKLYDELKIDLMGPYQDKNLLTALVSLEKLRKEKYSIEYKDIFLGLSQVKSLTGLRGRWESLSYNPRIICDIGHNLAGIKENVEGIKNIAYKNLHFVIGMVDDKQIDQILSLLPKDASYYFTRASIPRAMNEKILAAKAALHGLNGKYYPRVDLALKQARKNAGKEDLIFIGGSTFVVADIL